MIRTRDELRDYVSLDIPELRGMGENYRESISAVRKKIAKIAQQLKGLTIFDPRRRRLQAERGELLREMLRLETAQRQEREKAREAREAVSTKAQEALTQKKEAAKTRQKAILTRQLNVILRRLRPLEIKASNLKRKLRSLG